jgi:hypothetical protein
MEDNMADMVDMAEDIDEDFVASGAGVSHTQPLYFHLSYRSHITILTTKKSASARLAAYGLEHFD